ncbi:STAS domain-containing protein [Peribacillus glennii]|uniref:STAS domain-containing protein n=1 Tax=Peribacillus glennii TaxID=2303991 RepID=A0A372LG74_9BACI|nr:STAS domain-containing protein [Peribacillus glennii]RFU65069.1 STAS domain-containing protein [Peribacillus glennii]
MKEELRYIGEKIVENESVLAEKIYQLIDSEYTKGLNKAGAPQAILIEYRGELIKYFGEALYSDQDLINKKVTDWGVKAATFAIKYDVSLSNALRAVSFYRTVIWDVFTEELKKKQFAAITMLDVSKIIDPLLDKVFSVIGEVYENRSNELMKIAYTALEELSVPVVPIIDDIAVIPIVGSIDTNRAQLIMETSLNQGTKLNLHTVLFDVSGVPIIDTMVADQMFKIIKALKLTGIQAMITGIRPEIAQTIVSLGLDFKDVETAATLQQALNHLGLSIDSKPQYGKNGKKALNKRVNSQ